MRRTTASRLRSGLPFCVYIGKTTRCWSPSRRFAAGWKASSESRKSGTWKPSSAHWPRSLTSAAWYAASCGSSGESSSTAPVTRRTADSASVRAGAPSAVKSIEPSFDCHGRIRSTASLSTGHAGCSTTLVTGGSPCSEPTCTRISVMSHPPRENLAYGHRMRSWFPLARQGSANYPAPPVRHRSFSCRTHRRRLLPPWWGRWVGACDQGQSGAGFGQGPPDPPTAGRRRRAVRSGNTPAVTPDPPCTRGYNAGPGH